MNTAEIQIRWLNEHEISYGQQCLQQLWAPNHILAQNSDLFAWQFRQGPAPGTLGFLVMENEDRVLGCTGRVEIPCHSKGSVVPGAAITNAIVDPEYRSHGLGLRLLDEVYSSMQLVFNIGINTRVAKLYHSMGQYVLNPMPRYVCIADMDSMNSLLNECAHNAPTAEAFKACSLLKAPPPCDGYRVKHLSRNHLEQWNRAWTTIFAPHLQGVMKDSSYLLWRYYDHPVFDYGIWGVEDSFGNICGLTVTRVILLPGKIYVLRILEFLAKDQQAGKALSRFLWETVPPGTAFVEHIALGSLWKPLAEMGLSEAGNSLFTIYFNPPDFNYRNMISSFQVSPFFGKSADFIHSPSTYLTIADGDQDRPN